MHYRLLSVSILFLLFASNGSAQSPSGILSIESEFVFGEIDVFDRRATGNVRITNTGSGTLILFQGLILSSDSLTASEDFVLLGNNLTPIPSLDSLVIESGRSFSVPIAFSPTTVGSRRGILRLTHNGRGGQGGEEGVTTALLTGVGNIPSDARLTPFSRLAETTPPNFVTVPFQATTAEGRPLTLLGQASSYEASDGNVNVSDSEETVFAVENFDNVSFKLRTVLMLDNSTSIGADLNQMKRAARSFVDQMQPNQEVSLYVFSSDAIRLTGFTRDIDSLRAAIDGIRLGASTTNLYGAVIDGVETWTNSSEITRRDAAFVYGTLVVLSDGEDTRGEATLQNALAAIGDKAVVSIAVGATAVNALRTLHTAEYMNPVLVDDFGQVERAFGEVQRELARTSKSFYWLTYASPRREGRRSLTVRFKDRSSRAFFQVSYDADGFTDLLPGIYVNRSVLALAGTDTLDTLSGLDTLVTADPLLLTAATPQLKWVADDPSTVQITPLVEDGTRVSLRFTGEAGSQTQVTITDINNEPFYDNARTTLTVRSQGAFTSAPDAQIPDAFALSLPAPNPTSGPSAATLRLTAASTVQLIVYDALGREVSRPMDQVMPPGSHTVPIDLARASAGVYFLVATAQGETITRAIVRMR